MTAAFVTEESPVNPTVLEVDIDTQEFLATSNGLN
jgi:hypothetical protein